MNTTLHTRLAALLAAMTVSFLTVTAIAGYLPEQPAAPMLLALAPH